MRAIPARSATRWRGSRTCPRCSAPSPSTPAATPYTRRSCRSSRTASSPSSSSAPTRSWLARSAASPTRRSKVEQLLAQLPQQLVNGIWQGAGLALFALGFALVFGLLDVVNLAHGATYMWGAFFGLVCVTRFGWPLWVAIPVAMVGAGLLAVVLERLAFKPLRTLTVGSLVLWGGFLVLLLGLVGFREGEVRAALLGLGAALMVAGIVQDYRAVRPLQERQMPYLAPMI